MTEASLVGRGRSEHVGVEGYGAWPMCHCARAHGGSEAHMEAQLVGGNDSTIYSYLQRRVCDKGSVLDQRERDDE